MEVKNSGAYIDVKVDSGEHEQADEGKHAVKLEPPKAKESSFSDRVILLVVFSPEQHERCLLQLVSDC